MKNGDFVRLKAYGPRWSQPGKWHVVTWSAAYGDGDLYARTVCWRRYPRTAIQVAPKKRRPTLEPDWWCKRCLRYVEEKP